VPSFRRSAVNCAGVQSAAVCCSNVQPVTCVLRAEQQLHDAPGGRLTTAVYVGLGSVSCQAFGICGGQSGSGTGLSASISALPHHCYYTDASYVEFICCRKGKVIPAQTVRVQGG